MRNEGEGKRRMAMKDAFEEAQKYRRLLLLLLLVRHFAGRAIYRDAWKKRKWGGGGIGGSDKERPLIERDR